jgi:hypothetical protein
MQENKGFLSQDAMRRATGAHRIVLIFQKLKPESHQRHGFLIEASL